MTQCRDSSYLSLFPWGQGNATVASLFYLDTGNHWDHILLQAHAKLNSRGSCNQGLEVLNTTLKITCRFGLHLQCYVKYVYARNVAGIQRGKWRAEVDKQTNNINTKKYHSKQVQKFL